MIRDHDALRRETPSGGSESDETAALPLLKFGPRRGRPQAAPLFASKSVDPAGRRLKADAHGGRRRRSDRQRQALRGGTKRPQRSRQEEAPSTDLGQHGPAKGWRCFRWGAAGASGTGVRAPAGLLSLCPCEPPGRGFERHVEVGHKAEHSRLRDVDGLRAVTCHRQ